MTQLPNETRFAPESTASVFTGKANITTSTMSEVNANPRPRCLRSGNGPASTERLIRRPSKGSPSVQDSPSTPVVTLQSKKILARSLPSPLGPCRWSGGSKTIPFTAGSSPGSFKSNSPRVVSPVESSTTAGPRS